MRGEAQQPVAQRSGSLCRELESGGGLRQQVADRVHLVRIEDAPLGQRARKLHDYHLAPRIAALVAAFVAVQRVGVHQHQIVLGELLRKVAQNAFAPHVEREIQLVVFVEVQREIHLVVGPVVGDEQVVLAQRGDLFEDVFHGDVLAALRFTQK